MKTKVGFVVLVLAFVLSSFGQSPAPPPDLPAQPPEAKSIPAGENPPQSQTQVPPLLQKYDFGGQLKVLEDPTAIDVDRPAHPAAFGGGSSANGEIDTKPPKGFQPRTDVPLNSTAMEAVRVSETLRTGQNTPLAGADGRVLYAYGGGLPIIVCAPLRVCMIELQPGERITGEPQIGDSVRWVVSPAMYGRDEDATSVIVLKPQEPGLDTNLLITTDRRAYYLRLVSKPQEYVARAAFSYPEEESSQKWQQHLLAQRVHAQESKREAELVPAIIAAEKLNFNYKINGGTEPIRPVRVFDDGAKTYIQMRPEIQNREAPALVILGADGKGEMANYRVQRQTYIVDRLFDQALLILGAGKKAQKVEISREQQPRE